MAKSLDSLLFEVRQLRSDLESRGVLLSDATRSGLAHLDTLQNLDPGTELATVPAGLLDLSPDAIADLLERRCNLAAAGAYVYGTRNQLERGVLLELLPVIRTDLDDILDQLRPAFDQAATLVRRAVELGITTVTTAEQALLMNRPGLAESWRTIDAQAKILDGIARLRLRLADFLSFDPERPWNDELQIPASACFVDAAVPYELPREGGRSRWLRLSAVGQVRLLTVSESAAVVQRLKDQDRPAPPTATQLTAEARAFNYGGDVEAREPVALVSSAVR